MVRADLFVTKPNGEASKEPVIIYHDRQCDTFGILILQDNALQGYAFDVLQGDLKRARDQGQLTDTLPKV